ncbi:SET domain-containing protein, partial [Periconia macrospinosa]
MLLATSAVGVYPTSRYSLCATEATVVALKQIEAGQTIDELQGFLVPIDEARLHGLEAAQRTNSVMTVGKAPHLLVGPLARVNHDCEANAEFRAVRKKRLVSMVARRRIRRGEEVTVLYQGHYFEENNEGCLCSSCE